jgi:hypothetical protein
VTLFPTDVLSTVFGICNLFSRVITILAPLFAELKPEAIGLWAFAGATILAFGASMKIK